VNYNNLNHQNQSNNLVGQPDNQIPEFNNMNNQINNQTSQFNSMNNQVNNQTSQFNGMNNQTNNQQISNIPTSSEASISSNKNLFKDDKKLLYIIGGVILALMILVILYFTVFKKDEYKSYDDYIENQEKIKEKINKNFSIKDYKTIDGILIELTNNNNEIVDADIKVEFYDENGNVVNVKDGYMFSIPGKGVGYDSIYLYKEEYSTYKVTAKLNVSPYKKTYNDKVTVVSSSNHGDNYIIQIRNDSDVLLESIEVGVLFLGANSSVIDYSTESFSSVASGETVSGKVYIPYEEDYRNKISYENVEIKIVSATSTIN